MPNFLFWPVCCISILAILEIDLPILIRDKVVDLAFFFPTHYKSAQPDIGIKSYDQNTETSFSVLLLAFERPILPFNLAFERSIQNTKDVRMDNFTLHGLFKCSVIKSNF